MAGRGSAEPRSLDLVSRFQGHSEPLRSAVMQFDIQGEEIARKMCIGVPFLAQQLTNPNRMYEDGGSIPGLAQWVNDPALP